MNKLIKLLNRFKYGKIELTPKGEIFKRYCEDICKDELNHKIFEYEKLIYDIRKQLVEVHKLFLDRKEAAEFIVESYNKIL